MVKQKDSWAVKAVKIVGGVIVAIGVFWLLAFALHVRFAQSQGPIKPKKPATPAIQKEPSPQAVFDAAGRELLSKAPKVNSVVPYGEATTVPKYVVAAKPPVYTSAEIAGFETTATLIRTANATLQDCMRRGDIVQSSERWAKAMESYKGSLFADRKRAASDRDRSAVATYNMELTYVKNNYEYQVMLAGLKGGTTEAFSAFYQQAMRDHDKKFRKQWAEVQKQYPGSVSYDQYAQMSFVNQDFMRVNNYAARLISKGKDRMGYREVAVHGENLGKLPLISPEVAKKADPRTKMVIETYNFNVRNCKKQAAFYRAYIGDVKVSDQEYAKLRAGHQEIQAERAAIAGPRSKS